LLLLYHSACLLQVSYSVAGNGLRTVQRALLPLAPDDARPGGEQIGMTLFGIFLTPAFFFVRLRLGGQDPVRRGG
jgi:hypothetical protein